MSDKVVFTRDFLKSRAFRSLNAPAVMVFMDFRLRCRVKGDKRTGKLIVLNNGELVFPYKEALQKGHTRPKFRRALIELVKKGLMDVAHAGSGGWKGDVTLFGISERWRYFGTERFEIGGEENERFLTKDYRPGSGFQKNRSSTHR